MMNDISYDVLHIVNWIKNEYNFATNRLIYYYPTNFYNSINELASEIFLILNCKIKINKSKTSIKIYYNSEYFLLSTDLSDWMETNIWKIEGDMY